MRNSVIFAALLWTSHAAIVTAEAPSIPGCIPVRTDQFWGIDDAIPDGTGTPLPIPINISGLTGPVIDVDLDIDVTHSNVGHVDLFLTSPSNHTVTLASDLGNTISGAYAGVNFDDQAGRDITATTFTSGEALGNINPEKPLALFSGETPNGTWTINAYDDTAGTAGGVLDGIIHITTCSGTIGKSSAQTFTNATVTAIPDNSANGVASSLTVSGAPAGLCELSVYTNITHTYSGDLKIKLRAPTGKEVLLVNRVGGSRDNLFSNTTWSDTTTGESVNDVTYTDNVAAQSLPPSQALAAFYGIDPNGIWKLVVSDNANQDTGNINEWRLTMKSCSTDTDADGSGDSFDSCPADPAKTAPGVCGCGVADSDPESDGIYVCETTKEMKSVKIAGLKTLLKTIKVPTNAAQTTLMKSRAKQFKSSVNTATSYATSADPELSLKGTASVRTLNKALKDAANALSARITVTTLKAASDALKAYERALDA